MCHGRRPRVSRSLCLAPGPAASRVRCRTSARASRATAGPCREPTRWATCGPSWCRRRRPHIVAAATPTRSASSSPTSTTTATCPSTSIGGVDPQLLPGRGLVIHRASGPSPGVVGRRPTHFIPEDERGKAPEMNEQFIDIGARSREEALQRVAIGDPITFAPHFIELADGRFATLAADDRAGVYVAFPRPRALRGRPGGEPPTAISSTVHEETTFMGAKAQTPAAQPGGDHRGRRGLRDRLPRHATRKKPGAKSSSAPARFSRAAPAATRVCSSSPRGRAGRGHRPSGQGRRRAA